MYIEACGPSHAFPNRLITKWGSGVLNVQEPNKLNAIAQILPVGDSLCAFLAMVVKSKYPTSVITKMKQEVG